MRPETRDNRWIALYVLCTGMLMIVLDATIVNVALPTIQSDLHFSQSGLAWVVNGYLITFGGLCCSPAGSVTCSAAGGCSCTVSRSSRRPRLSAGSPRVRGC